MADGADLDIAKYVMVDAEILSPGHYVFLAHREAVLRNGSSECELIEHCAAHWMPWAAWSWEAVGFCRLEDIWIVLGRDGEVAEFDGASPTESHIDRTHALGPFRGVVSLNGDVYAYGMKREVFFRIDSGGWVREMDGFDVLLNSGELTRAEFLRLRRMHLGGINAMAVDADGKLTAVGMRGEIWIQESRQWKKIDSPTNVMLKDLTYGDDGRLYACGLMGTLLAGHAEKWMCVEYTGVQGLDFCSIAWFKGFVYVADGHSLRRLNEGVLEVVDFGVTNIVPCSRVVAAQEILLSIAGQEVWESRDGRSWSCLLG